VIKNVINPATTGLTVTSGFTVIHLDSNLTAKALGSINGVTIASYPAEL